MQLHDVSLLFALLLVGCTVGFIDGFTVGALSIRRLAFNPSPTNRAPSLMTWENNEEPFCSERLIIDSNFSLGYLENNEQGDSRRFFLSKLASVAVIIGPSTFSLPPKADAISVPLFGSSDRRQLELCLTTVLRTEYWASSVANTLKSRLLSSKKSALNGPEEGSPDSSEELTDYQRKQPYLEARLGAKALLTQKIGGGANANVLKLASFHLKECLDDGRYWCSELAKSGELPSSLDAKSASKAICNGELSSAADDLVEALASLVEFDGLETTIDPSPRSSLMMNMYTDSKGMFVYRTLTERVIPNCDKYLSVFGKDKRNKLEQFISKNYSDESS